MDPRAFVKVSVDSLGLRAPPPDGAAAPPAPSSPFLCEIRLNNLPVQTAPIPLLRSNEGVKENSGTGASFYLDGSALAKILSRKSAKTNLEVVVFTAAGQTEPFSSSSCFGFAARVRKQLGSFKVRVSPDWGSGKALKLHHGWTDLHKAKDGVALHLRVLVQPDPRFLFQFDGEIALSPQIVQVQGTSHQPVFSCKFTRERNFHGRFGQFDKPTNTWMGGSNLEKERRERKGWLVTIHDLSGSAVAAASMVTPFVPMPDGRNRVSKSNPGAWLILRPEPCAADSCWQPWGRLEAWRESSGTMGCKFQLITDGIGGVMETAISYQKGGEFTIDTEKLLSASPSPVNSPQSSGDFVFNLGLPTSAGFVMSCVVPAMGKSTGMRKRRRGRKPAVQLAARHVSCVEDAAVFMALTAAVDLSVDACQPFSQKLRKELSEPLETL